MFSYELFLRYNHKFIEAAKKAGYKEEPDNDRKGAKFIKRTETITYTIRYYVIDGDHERSDRDRWTLHCESRRGRLVDILVRLDGPPNMEHSKTMEAAGETCINIMLGNTQ